jgi:hypothetical protein
MPIYTLPVCLSLRQIKHSTPGERDDWYTTLMAHRLSEGGQVSVRSAAW